MAERPTKTLSLDDLIALNDEIAALAKAGVPLHDALAGLGDDLPAGLANVSRTLAERTERGQSLSEAIAASGQQFPAVYRAIVEVGIRSGRLPAALEQLGGTARRIAALRRLVASAMIYPTIVALLAYGLFLFFIVRIAPAINQSAPVAAGQQPPAIVQSIARLNHGIEWWGPILPAIAVMLLVLWWLASRRATMLQPAVAGPVLGKLAPVRRLLAESTAAGFADTLALLVEHQVPITDAIPMAAEASGDKRLIQSARELAAEIAAGGKPSAPADARAKSRGLIPPLLRWLIATAASQRNLPAVLRQNADMYRRRAVARAEWLRWELPVILTLAIGGTITLVYALTMFIPWVELLKQLTHT